MSREFLDYVEDIIDAMSKAQNFIREMDYEAFAKDFSAQRRFMLISPIYSARHLFC